MVLSVTVTKTFLYLTEFAMESASAVLVRNRVVVNREELHTAFASLKV